jgi:hypothetical protein
MTAPLAGAITRPQLVPRRQAANAIFDSRAVHPSMSDVCALTESRACTQRRRQAVRRRAYPPKPLFVWQRIHAMRWCSALRLHEDTRISPGQRRQSHFQHVKRRRFLDLPGRPPRRRAREHGSIDGRGLLNDVEDLLRLLHLGVARSLLGHLPPQLHKQTDEKRYKWKRGN